MRVTVDDVLQHIAQDLRNYSGADMDAGVCELLSGFTFDLHISITTDFEETELNYLERYGRGDTFYFRLVDYDHGKFLAEQLFFRMKSVHPQMHGYIGEQFNADDKLYLFIHMWCVAPCARHREPGVN